MVFALLLASCALPDYGDVPFLCGDQDACPAGYRCMGGQCWRAGLSRTDGAAAAEPDAVSFVPDASASIDARQPDASVPDAPSGNGGKYDPCRTNQDCAADLCCDSELYECLISSIARCMP